MLAGKPVALGSTANKRALIAMLENEKPAQPLIIAMDNDEAGSKANRELAEGLERLRIPFYRLDISKPYKDANEALNADRDAFRAAVEQAENIEAETLEAEREQLRREAAVYSLPDFIKKIEQSKRTSFIPTGFSSLDDLLDGWAICRALCGGGYQFFRQDNILLADSRPNRPERAGCAYILAGNGKGRAYSKEREPPYLA